MFTARALQRLNPAGLRPSLLFTPIGSPHRPHQANNTGINPLLLSPVNLNNGVHFHYSNHNGRKTVSTNATAGLIEMVGAFTPANAVMGGAILGISTTAQLLLAGRVLGISGAVKGLVQGGQGAEWRIALLAGMMLTSVPLAMILPSSFVALPDTYTMTRALVGGLLVGLGSALGNGCTSGHGLCGLARFSPRSLVYTLTFMAAGAISATALGTAVATGLTSTTVFPATLPDVSFMYKVLAGSALASVSFIALGQMSKRLSSTYSAITERLATVLIGAVFASGLVISGMTLPSKVAGFLSPTLPAFDPSLALVLGSGLAVSMIAYQSVYGRLPLLPESMRFDPTNSKSSAGMPLLVKNYSLPTANVIDSKLILGGILFGAGWGISGMCPGPAIVAFSGSLGVWGLSHIGTYVGPAVASSGLIKATGIYLIGILAGMAVEGQLPTLLKTVSGKDTEKK